MQYMVIGQIGRDGEAVVLHVVSDSGREPASVTIPSQNMVEMIVINRARLTQKLKYAIDQNVSVRGNSLITSGKLSISIRAINHNTLNIYD